MESYNIPIWKTAPFCRLLIPLIMGIVLQWYQQLPLYFIMIFFAVFLVAILLFSFMPLALQFRFRGLLGALFFLLIAGFGLLISRQKDVRNNSDWFGHQYNDSSLLLIRIDEPLIERTKSYKVTGYVEQVVNGSVVTPAAGKLFIYFAKDSAAGSLRYGDEILVSKPLQKIKNAGNPGAFNYERYATFHQAFHTVYLKEKDWIILELKNSQRLYKCIFSLQAYIISVLQKNISADNNILGIAEALLIGYKEDLDKDLVQAYSNAGVVHIIAISGLHLGLIYVMLAWLFNRLPFIKNYKLLNVGLILSCLWLFALLTGASASVLRSAVMFTCILIGKNFFKQTSIYNSLASSAFVLLCYDPYFLWDVGFQLSYLAVIGIVALQKPIIGLLYLKNGWLNKCWNMLAVTLAAQLITFPLCIYYFHQFPNLFFITNLLAVPLSTIILFIEIFLVAFSWIPFVGFYVGKLIALLIWLMNAIIKTCNDIPYSLLDNIYANVATTWLLYIFIIAATAWLIHKHKVAIRVALLSMFLFVAVQTYSTLSIYQQKWIVVYNVPQHQAIDFIYHDKYHFVGDSSLINDGALRNFHLRPARVSLQATTGVSMMPYLYQHNIAWQFFNKKILVIDSSLQFHPLEKKVVVDLLLLSKNPRIKIAQLATAIKPSIIVFDASNSLWKIADWKKECETLALPYFSIPEKGAFMLDVE